ncbi:MAG: hypothetical protein LBL69_06985 [Zoogloeaceae bacterium]|jgi:hypothetical protein|nr:hypothetical protein [Zoogloeaceae bacterium]
MSETQTLWVRIIQKSPASAFFRCGMQFGKGWREVAVDAATARRLKAEQMLEVSDSAPDAATPVQTPSPVDVAPDADDTAPDEPAPAKPAAKKKAAK